MQYTLKKQGSHADGQKVKEECCKYYDNKRRGQVSSRMLYIGLLHSPGMSLKQALKELRLIREGKIKTKSWRELKRELEGK